eukprot:scaffold99736_cov61-Phaeocystis_antarctica.AAC.2
MSAAKPEMVREESILTPAQDKQMQRIDQNGDGVISKKEAQAEARFAAEQHAKLSFWKMVALGIAALLFLSWIGNACLTAAIVTLSKDLKVEGSALKNTNGDAISTLGQKKVYQVTLVEVTHRALGEQGSNDTHAQHSTVVAQVACGNVLDAITSIENGIDGSLVKIDLGSGRVWEPRASAATYVNLDNSFGIEQIYLDDRRDVSYDVTCEISKADCESAPESVCDAVMSSEVIFSDDDRRALSFEDAFDGEVNVDSRRRLYACKNHDAGWRGRWISMEYHVGWGDSSHWC